MADLHRPGELHLAVLRSPYPHARIRLQAVDQAECAAGVHMIVTAAHLGGARIPSTAPRPHPAFERGVSLELHEPPIPVLAQDIVRYVGESIAAVVADSRAMAEDATELLRLDVWPMPAVMDFSDAFGGKQLYDEVPGNVAASIRIERGNRPPAASVAHTVRAKLRIGRHGAVPLETRGALALPELDGRITLWTSTQIPHQVRAAITTALGWPEERLRVIAPAVGGGFGGKANVYPEEVLVTFCAATLRRPVRWVEDRFEHLVASTQSRDQLHEVELAVDGQGTILSYTDDFVVNIGASNHWVGGVIANTGLHALGPYRMPYVLVTGRAVTSNKAPSAQYRGAGRPEACFALERSLDIAAAGLMLDPFEIRRRNLIQPHELPYAQGLPQRDGVPITYDASDYPAILETARGLAEPESWPGLRDTAERAGKRFGIGCAAYVEATGRGPFEGALVKVLRDGSVDVYTGAASAGQGHATTLARVCANVLGIAESSVRVVGGDTDLIPRGIGTFGSRTAVVAGNAVHEASLEVRARLCEMAAEVLQLQRNEVAWLEGEARASNGQRLGLLDIASTAGAADHLQATAYWSPETVTWTMGVQVVAVEVSPRTGAVRILRHALAHDSGPSLDEATVEGQLVGGIAQGLGGALLEDFTYSDEGQPESTTLATYLTPNCLDMSEVRLATIQASASNPLGIKGVGESGTIATMAAVANAVSLALGAELNETPLTPVRVWTAAQSGR